MKRIKKSYVIIIALLALTVTFFGASYAFFTNKVEGNGKLNIVVGDLTYRLESKDLNKNKITIGPSEIKEITLTLNSLNNIDSKYELYYTLNKTNNNIRVGYSVNTEDNISGTIEANAKKEITIVLRNEGSIESIVEFGTIGGLVNNDLVLTKGNSLNQVVGKYEAYSIGEEITLTDGSKWHVLETSDESEKNVVLLSDYNLNSDGTYNDECGRDINSVYKCNTAAFDLDNTNVYSETDVNNIGAFIRYTYIPFIDKNLPEVTNITLPTAEQIAQADSQIFNISTVAINSSWLLSTNYWTKTANSTNSNSVWYVYGEDNRFGRYDANYSNRCGVRPTITVPKKYIVETISSTTSLSIGTAVEAIDGSKWHVLEASSSDSRYVTLLSDYNLNSDGTYNTSCGRDINGVYTCSPMAFDPDNTNSYDKADSNNIGYFIKNTYEPLVTENLLETTNVTIPTAELIAKVDGKSFDASDDSGNGVILTSSWLLTTNYWTKTLHSAYSYVVWYVSSPDLYIGYHPSSFVQSGARPVITTLKTNLLAQ